MRTWYVRYTKGYREGILESLYLQSGTKWFSIRHNLAGGTSLSNSLIVNIELMVKVISKDRIYHKHQVAMDFMEANPDIEFDPLWDRRIL